jgi:two-component system chemotaxis response regulator CheY
MPNKTGLELVDEIMSIDSDAFVVILSSDSNRENVLASISKGAIGFLAKPIQKDKIEKIMNQCITTNAVSWW